MTDSPPKKTGRAARPTDQQSVARRAALEEWQKSLSDQSVAEILRYRDLRKLTNDQLRSRLSLLGWDLTRDSLASILASKRKSMPVTDLLLFAQAMNVPPIALVFPLWSNEPTRLWPADEPGGFAYEDARWFAGRAPERGGAYIAAPETAVVDEYYDVGDIVARFEEIDEELNAIAGRHYFLAHDVDDEARAKEVADELRASLEDIADLRGYIRSAYRGVRLPELRPALRFLDDRGYKIPDLPIADFETADEIRRRTEMDERAAEWRAGHPELTEIDHGSPSNPDQ